jgi:hypothetical protein
MLTLDARATSWMVGAARAWADSRRFSPPEGLPDFSAMP